MNNKLHYDFTLAAIMIQSLVRGHLMRKLLRLALQRASQSLEDICNDMRTIIPGYAIIDGIDFITK